MPSTRQTSIQAILTRFHHPARGYSFPVGRIALAPLFAHLGFRAAGIALRRHQTRRFQHSRAPRICPALTELMASCLTLAPMPPPAELSNATSRRIRAARAPLVPVVLWRAVEKPPWQGCDSLHLSHIMAAQVRLKGEQGGPANG
ncbi:hypothetical protein CCMA1212_000913 [Trichoderma ghanense]|uniref:Uncharacterized protein n=1 Tax=Trichoderma ghanense TaxID=65468 RepID=A0ABY2HF17_9HYPO